MKPSILTLSAFAAAATIAVALAPIGATPMKQLRVQPAATPNACELSGYPLFALANISNADQRAKVRGRPIGLTSGTSVTFYNLSNCGYELDQYTDSNNDTHCELVSSNNTVIVQFWFDPAFYSSTGTTDVPITCSNPGPMAQPARSFASWSRVRTPNFR